MVLPNFHEYVRTCTLRGISSSLNTNGILIRNRLAAAVGTGLGKIAISVDAADDLLQQIRSGLTRERLEAAMLAAVEIVAGTQTRLSAAITLGSSNLHQFSQTLKFIAACGIRHVSVESVHHWADDKALNATSLFHGEPMPTIQRIEAGLDVANSLGLNVEIFDFYRIADNNVRGRMLCAWPWDAAYLTCKGEVTPCCVNLEATPSNTMGSLSDMSLNDIWRSDRYVALRRDMLAGFDWSFCKDCVYRMEFGEVAND
jgi:MoaA/NifB/PqqE/SkfB family radical SAM enzyme